MKWLSLFVLALVCSIGYLIDYWWNWRSEPSRQKDD